MASQSLSKLLAAALLGLALSPLPADATATSSPSNLTAGAMRLDPPAAPSHCRQRTYFGRGLKDSYLHVRWDDNSTDEDGFVLETWLKQSGVWRPVASITLPASTSSYSFTFAGRYFPDYRFRVQAFNAAGSSAWSHFAH